MDEWQIPDSQTPTEVEQMRIVAIYALMSSLFYSIYNKNSILFSNIPTDILFWYIILFYL